MGTGHFGLYRELDLPKLFTRRYTSRLLKFYEVFNRQTTGRMNRDNFEAVYERNPYPSRRINDLTMPMVTICHRSFKHAGIRDWNALPENLRTMESKQVSRGN